jgi:FKBP-type peptidyl-prolyl cis-trans isomerase
MEDRTMIIVGVVVLVIVLFVLLIIPASKTDILGTMGSDSLTFNANTTPSAAPIPTITELQGQDLRVGTGSAEVKQGDTIIVHYTGYFLDGKKVDSSYDRNEPFKVTLGANQVIPGFEQGVIGMRVGGQRRIFIPSDLAYGAKGQGAIPPNTAIAFDIELLNISAVVSPTPEATPSPEPEAEESPTPTPGG